MALRTNVYISDVTNLTEARYYAGMGVSIIGFDATPDHTSFISTQQFDAITSWLSGIQTSWQWHSAPSEQLMQLIDSSPADFIELNATPTTDQLQFLSRPLLIRTSSVKDIQAIDLLPLNSVYAIIWEGDLSVITSLNTPLSCFIETQPPFDQLDSILKWNKGLGLKGSPESRPGWNDFDQMADLLESLEIN
jgi:phosphoribosylanthranilate isomerase